jgi:hypothetical protein
MWQTVQQDLDMTQGVFSRHLPVLEFLSETGVFIFTEGSFGTWLPQAFM